jgi:hypothetical protein
VEVLETASSLVRDAKSVWSTVEAMSSGKAEDGWDATVDLLQNVGRAMNTAEKLFDRRGRQGGGDGRFAAGSAEDNGLAEHDSGNSDPLVSANGMKI